MGKNSVHFPEMLKIKDCVSDLNSLSDGLATSSTNLEPNLWFLRVPSLECSTLSLTNIRSGFSSLYFYSPPASNDTSASPNGLTATASVAITSLSASSLNIFA